MLNAIKKYIIILYIYVLKGKYFTYLSVKKGSAGRKNKFTTEAAACFGYFITSVKTNIDAW